VLFRSKKSHPLPIGSAAVTNPAPDPAQTVPVRQTVVPPVNDPAPDPAQTVPIRQPVVPPVNNPAPDPAQTVPVPQPVVPPVIDPAIVIVMSEGSNQDDRVPVQHNAGDNNGLLPPYLRQILEEQAEENRRRWQMFEAQMAENRRMQAEQAEENRILRRSLELVTRSVDDSDVSIDDGDERVGKRPQSEPLSKGRSVDFPRPPPVVIDGSKTSFRRPKVVRSPKKPLVEEDRRLRRSLDDQMEEVRRIHAELLDENRRLRRNSVDDLDDYSYEEEEGGKRP